MPELKHFLKSYEAEEYRGVQVEYIHGRRAVLSIYHDGELQEDVTLSDLKTREEMHQLMVEKGFEKMTPEEIEAMRARREQEDQEADRRRLEEKEKRRKEMEIKNQKRREEALKRMKEKEEAEQKAKAEAEAAAGKKEEAAQEL